MFVVFDVAMLVVQSARGWSLLTASRATITSRGYSRALWHVATITKLMASTLLFLATSTSLSHVALSLYLVIALRQYHLGLDDTPCTRIILIVGSLNGVIAAALGVATIVSFAAHASHEPHAACSSASRSLGPLAAAHRRALLSSERRLRVLMISVGTEGDVRPLVALALALQRRGHDAAICTTDNLQPLVTKHGIEFLSCGAARLPQPTSWGLSSSVAEALKGMMGVMKHGYFKLGMGFRDAAISYKPTVLLSTGVTAAYGFDLAESLGDVAHWRVLLSPTEPTACFSPVGSGLLSSSMGGFNRLRSTKFFLDVITAIGESGLGVLMTQFQHEGLQLRKSATRPFRRLYEMGRVPTLMAFDECIVPRPSDWPASCDDPSGFMLLDAPVAEQDDRTKDDGLMGWLVGGNEESDKPVCVTFGSMATNDVRLEVLMLSALVATVVRCRRRCLFLSGWGVAQEEHLHELLSRGDGALRDAHSQGRLYCVASAPHERVFPHCACVVYHGSAGTLARCIEAGVPVAIVPVLTWSDQIFFGERITELGAGALILPGHAGHRAEGGAQADEELVRKVAQAVERLVASSAGTTVVSQLRARLATGTSGADRAARTMEFNLIG